MDEKLLNYQSFFADQIQEEVAEQKKMNNSPMSRLFKSGELALGYVDSVQQELGLVVFKFPWGMAPRLKVQKSITVIKKGAKQEFGERITDWSCKWGIFVLIQTIIPQARMFCLCIIYLGKAMAMIM